MENIERSDDSLTQLNALRAARDELSEPDPPIKNYIEIGFIYVFVKCLSSPNSTIQLEAALCLRSIANGKPKHVEAFIDTGVVPSLLKLIVATDEVVSGRIIEILAILLTVKPKLRGYFMDLNVVEPLLLSIFPEETPKKMITKRALILAYMCQSNDRAPNVGIVKIIEEFFPILTEIVYYHGTPEIIETTKKFIQFKQERDDERNDLSIDSKVIGTLIHVLGYSNDTKLQSLIFEILSYSTNEQTNEQNQQHVMDSGKLKSMSKFLKHSDTEITSKAMNLIANISTNNENQIQSIFDAELMPQIIKNLDSFYFNIRKDATLLIAKIAMNGNRMQLSEILDFDIIPQICRFLIETKSQKAAQTILSAIYNFVQSLENRAQIILTQFAAHGGYDQVQKLSKHKNKDLQNIASKLRYLIADGNDGSKTKKNNEKVKQREEL